MKCGNVSKITQEKEEEKEKEREDRRGRRRIGEGGGAEGEEDMSCCYVASAQLRILLPNGPDQH